MPRLGVERNLDLAGLVVPVTTYAMEESGIPGAVDPVFEAITDDVRAGRLVLLNSTPGEFDRSRERDMMVIAESIGECAAVFLTKLGGERVDDASPEAIVLGASDVIRLVASYAEPMPAPEDLYRSATLRWDYSAFARLWQFKLGIPTWGLPVDVAKRRSFMADAGVFIGRWHRVGIVWADAHVDNFERFSGKVGVLDMQHTTVLYRAPSAARSALDLIPILTTLEPASWETFRDGYVHGRGSDGPLVFQFIERRDGGRGSDVNAYLRSFPRLHPDERSME